VWRAAARALTELGCPALFIAGIAAVSIGPAAPWFVLAAVVLSMFLRSADLEARALFIPGGLFGSVRDTFGRRPATFAAAAQLIADLALSALAAAVAGHYAFAVAGALASSRLAGIASDTAARTIAIALIAVVWGVQRQGRSPSDLRVSRAVGFAIAAIGVLVVWGSTTLAVRQPPLPPLPLPPAVNLLWFAVALGHALPCLGGLDSLGHAALDLQQPRIRNLLRVARLVGAYTLFITAVTAFLVVGLLPADERLTWMPAPLAGVAMSVAGPTWLRYTLLLLVAAAAVVFLASTVRAASSDGHGTLARLVEEGVFGPEFRTLHHRFGTPWRIIDATAVAQLVFLLVSDGDVVWLARMYAFAVVCAAMFKIAALVRYRSYRREKRAYQVPLTFAVRGGEWPIGLYAIALLLAIPVAALVVTLDPPTLACVALVNALALVLIASERGLAARSSARDAIELDEFQLLPSDDVDLQQVDARPGNFLVPVRKPHSMTHLVAALRAAGDRDVVAMTVRLVGVDVSDDPTIQPRATEDERRLLSAVIATAEREGKAVRLMIVPGVNVFDSVIETAVRLESSEIHVGESETLSAGEQARLLGEAWERAAKTAHPDVRLVVHHPRGTTAAFHLGAHAPAFRPEDFEHIHRLWLDVVRAVGPRSVHHRDVVRAALIHMEQDLNGPDRDAVLQLVRETARPADELAAVIRERDFGRVRDMVRNQPAGDLAEMLTDLSIEERVLVFRILPRKEAAETFAYISADEQERLLKAMASSEAAALLNDMAPDDRTMFLEELPAEVTRQLLALLTPEERAVAVRLLGYPEGSIGRLMTPHYVRVKEDWTIAQVLDHVRLHGRDSETLNMLYVVDETGTLIDDIRIREVLLTAPTNLVRNLMDRKYVALKATDGQETAVKVFKDEDRTALPVTDSAGVLIGIVTVDDVLDVAEAKATQDIQRVGGSEALDEPYMDIAFTRMIQKRAGWLTALFLGEMLTATAMGAFEKEIERAVVLALFVPLIISSGGNSGSQASTLVIRALALGEVTLADWWHVMRREIGAGLALGGILGAIGFMRIAVWSTFSSIYGEHWLLVATTVAISLVGVVLWGTLTGSLLPFLLRRLGFDPAASSAPFVATLVDVTGLVIYFTVGIVVLRGTLL
jgi:magnesium transporter